MLRLWRLSKSLARLRWRLRPPRQRDVLLFFKTGADVIAPYFRPNEFQVLDLRESEVNLAVAFKCLLTRDLSAQSYARQFINIAKPKLIVTFIDNFPQYFLLKSEFPEVSVWLIQNGVRSERGDLFGLLKDDQSNLNFKVDKMFMFGSAIGAKYNQYISGTIIEHGSFKNNCVAIKPCKKNLIAYVSTYRPDQSRSFIVPESTPDRPIKYEQIIARREKAIIWLANYCQENQLQLSVIGKHEHPEQEEQYYRSLLIGHEFEFMARKTSTSSYEAVDQAEIVVFTSSTLGYEALARGKKTAALMLDAELIGADALRFGWPNSFISEGKFWTHKLDKTRMYEILEFLRKVDDHEWRELLSQTIQDVINFDAGNSKFSDAIEELRQTW